MIHWKSLLIGGLLCMGSHSYAKGSGQGNGGDLVVCTMFDGSKTYELLDYYEGRINHNFEIDETKFEKRHYLDKARDILKGLYHFNDGGISNFLSNVYENKLEQQGLSLVEKFKDEIKFVDYELDDIPDHGEVRIASNCEIQQLVIQHADIQNDHREYIINKNLWEKLDENQKASVVTHEIIYHLALHVNHRDSRYVRKANYALVANINRGEIFKDIKKYLLDPSSLVKNCDESLDSRYLNWAKDECLLKYLKNEGGYRNKPNGRLKWIKDLVKVFEDNEFTNLDVEVLEHLHTKLSSKELYFRGKTLFELISKSNNKMIDQFGEFLFSSTEAVQKDYAARILYLYDSRKLERRVLDELIHYSYSHYRTRSGGAIVTVDPDKCNYYEEIFCEKEITKKARLLDYMVRIDFLLNNINYGPAKIALEKIIFNKNELNRFDIAKITMSLIKSKVQDAGLFKRLLELAVNSKERGHKREYLSSNFATIVNINNHLKSNILEKTLRKALLKNILDYASLYSSFFHRFHYNHSSSKFEVFNLENLLNKKYIVEIANALNKYSIKTNRSHFLSMKTIFFNFLNEHYSLLLKEEKADTLFRIYTESIELIRSDDHRRLYFENKILWSLTELKSIKRELGAVIIKSLSRSEFKRIQNTRIVLTFLKMALKLESIDIETKFNIKTIAETDSRSEVRKVATEVYSKL